jgi:PKHD-type hydroxylase
MNIPVRKLSISIQLTDPEEYEGGELKLYDGEEEGVLMDKTQGTLIIFPSYVLHEVMPVTKGTRNSLVTWVTGKQFK